MTRKKRIVIALGGNALGNTLPEQMAAVKITAHAIVDLIEEGCEVVIAHGNGPQVGMVNKHADSLTPIALRMRDGEWEYPGGIEEPDLSGYDRFITGTDDGGEER